MDTRIKFTKASVAEKAAASGAKEECYWDSALPGFGIRCRDGSAHWTVMFRIGTKQRRISLGKTTKVDLDKARAMARQHFADVANKVDPTAARAKATKAASLTFGSLIEDFIAHQTAKGRAPSYVKRVARTLNHQFKHFHQLAFADIDRSMVADTLKGIAKNNGPVTADRDRAHTMKYFTWAIGEGKCENNPVDHTNKSSDDDTAREGLSLRPVDLQKIWNACVPGDDFGDIIRLLMLTGQRRSEIGALEWAEFDVDEQTIHLRGRDRSGHSRTKNGNKHDIPLSRQALAILKSRPANGRKHVFGSRGESGFGGWSKGKLKLDKACGVTGWHIHDLRHTLKTWMQANKVPRDVRDEVQNHSGDGMDALYGHHAYEDEKRGVLNQYGDHIAALVGPTKPRLKIAA